MKAWQLNESDASTYHVLFNVTFISMLYSYSFMPSFIYKADFNLKQVIMQKRCLSQRVKNF